MQGTWISSSFFVHGIDYLQASGKQKLKFLCFVFVIIVTKKTNDDQLLFAWMKIDILAWFVYLFLCGISSLIVWFSSSTVWFRCSGQVLVRNCIYYYNSFLIFRHFVISFLEYQQVRSRESMFNIYVFSRSRFLPASYPLLLIIMDKKLG